MSTGAGAIKSGHLFLLETLVGGIWKRIGGLRSTGVTINKALIEITNKDTDEWRCFLSNRGIKTVDFSGSGVTKVDDDFDLLKGRVLAGESARYRVTEEDGTQYEGNFMLASQSFAGEHADAQTFELTLNSDGPVSITKGGKNIHNPTAQTFKLIWKTTLGATLTDTDTLTDSTTSAEASIPTTTDTNAQLVFLFDPTANVTGINIGGFNQIGAFAKEDDTVTLNGVEYQVFRSENLLVADLFENQQVTITY